jgi:triacylglycerol lipase
MGGQTIRQLEELLRNGNREEIEYQKKHGGEISPLFKRLPLRSNSSS